MILVVSKDEDFASVISELAEQELQLPCKVVKSFDEAKPLLSSKVIFVVASEAGGKWGVPAIAIPKQDAPIRIQKLLTDMAALLQKSGIDESIAIGKYKFQPVVKKLTFKDKAVSLTDKEVQLLQSMLEAGASGVAKEALLKDVWGFEAGMDTHTLETHIYRLRAKFRELGEEHAIIAMENGYALGIKT